MDLSHKSIESTSCGMPTRRLNLTADEELNMDKAEFLITAGIDFYWKIIINICTFIFAAAAQVHWKILVYIFAWFIVKYFIWFRVEESIWLVTLYVLKITEFGWKCYSPAGQKIKVFHSEKRHFYFKISGRGPSLQIYN